MTRSSPFPDTPANHALLRAIRRDNPAAVRAALVAGADPHATYPLPCYATLFAHAALANKENALEALLASGADPAFVGRRIVNGTVQQTGPAFVEIVDHGETARARAWLDRFPALRSARMLRAALLRASAPKQPPDLFPLMLSAAQSLPRLEWDFAPLDHGGGQWVRANRPIEKLEAVRKLSPVPTSADGLAYLLHEAVLARHATAVAWLMAQGASPDRSVADRASFGTARAAALATNQASLLGVFDAASPQAFNRKKWNASLRDAFIRQARASYERIWEEAPLAPDVKRAAVAALRFPMRGKIFAAPAPGSEGEEVDHPLLAACRNSLGRKTAAWVQTILDTCHTTRENRTHAAHALCKGAAGEAAQASHRTAFVALVDRGVDWNAPVLFDFEELTLRERAQASAALGELVQKMEATRLAGELDNTLPPTPPSFRKLRL